MVCSAEMGSILAMVVVEILDDGLGKVPQHMVAMNETPNGMYVGG